MQQSKCATGDAGLSCALLVLQGFCYQHQQPVVYFACEGQMHCFKQGQNRAEHVWDGASSSAAPAFLQVPMPEEYVVCLLRQLSPVALNFV